MDTWKEIQIIYHFDAPNGSAGKLSGFKNVPTFWNVWGPGRWADCIIGTPSPLGYGRWENRCIKLGNIKRKGKKKEKRQKKQATEKKSERQKHMQALAFLC